jgi:hypothetical protein
MTRRAVFAVSAIWLALVVASFVAFALTPPTDIGFVRGLNRVTVFLSWQAGAFIAAIVASVITWNLTAGTRTVKIVGYFPLAAMVGLYVLTYSVAVFFVSMEAAEHSNAATPPPKVTAPAPTVR